MCVLTQCLGLYILFCCSVNSTNSGPVCLVVEEYLERLVSGHQLAHEPSACTDASVDEEML